MEMKDEIRLEASRAVVWEALNDPDVLKACIPGCETLEKVSDTEFVSLVVVKVGPIKAKFSGKVTLADIVPPTGYRLIGEGQGGVAGFAKSDITVELVEEGPAQTLLRYGVSANIGGKIAQLGARMIDSTARKMADQFFTSFRAAICAPAADDDVAVAAPIAVAGTVAAPGDDLLVTMVELADDGSFDWDADGRVPAPTGFGAWLARLFGAAPAA
ncbi:MAG: carbon monoxide dehydrogenase subunit G, partial [Burkholderiaceae bacterium]